MRRWTVMVQREIADRLRAAPGSRTYGSPSVVAQLACEVKLLRTVDPAVFRPRPRVESAILAPAPHRAGRRRRRRASWSAPPSPTAASPWPARSSTSGRARSPPPGRRWRGWDWRRTPAPRRSRPRISPRYRRSCGPATESSPTRCRSTPPPSSTSASTSARVARTGCTSSARCSSRWRSPIRSRSTEAERDEVVCPGSRARTWRRGRWRPCASGAGKRPPLRVEIEKRIPVAAGLGGGSADAAAVLRLARARRWSCRVDSGLEQIAAELGADVPSQLAPSLALVRARGSGSSALPDPAPHAVVLLPGGGGLGTAEVFAEADRLGLGRSAARSSRHLAARLRAAAGAGASPLAYADLLANDLEPAARSLRPEIGEALDDLRDAGRRRRAADRLRPDRLRPLRGPRCGPGRRRARSTATTRSSARRGRLP